MMKETFYQKKVFVLDKMIVCIRLHEHTHFCKINIQSFDYFLKYESEIVKKDFLYNLEYNCTKKQQRYAYKIFSMLLYIYIYIYIYIHTHTYIYIINVYFQKFIWREIRVENLPCGLRRGAVEYTDCFSADG